MEGVGEEFPSVGVVRVLDRDAAACGAGSARAGAVRVDVQVWHCG